MNKIMIIMYDFKNWQDKIKKKKQRFGFNPNANQIHFKSKLKINTLTNNRGILYA